MKKDVNTSIIFFLMKLSRKNVITVLTVLLLSCSLMYAQEEGPIVAPPIELQQLKQPIKHIKTKQSFSTLNKKTQIPKLDSRHIGPPVNLEALRNVKLNKAEIDAARKQNCPKLSSALCKLYLTCDDKKAANEQAARNGLELKNNKVIVTIYPKHGKTTNEIDFKTLKNLGVVIDLQASRSLRALIPINQLEATANIRGIGRIAQPNKPMTNNTITSEGVMWMNSDEWQMNGHGGAGVKVGIIDYGFAGLSAALSAGELPIDIDTVNFSGVSMESGSQHGTAVAEIVYDVAPDVEFYLYKINDETSLELAKNNALANGVDIINMSVGFYSPGGYYDGTGIVCDIAQDAIDNGILWVNSAGNEAQKHFRDVFENNGSGFHDFDYFGTPLNPLVVQGTGSLYITFPYEPVILDLNWDDYPNSNQNYDLLLFQSFDGINWDSVYVSNTIQDGTVPPEEFMFFQDSVFAYYAVAIRNASATINVDFTLHSWGNQGFYFGNSSNSIINPATVEDVITVGAIDKDFYLLGPQAPYSSQGPTNSGVMKPNIAAPTNTESFVYNGPFGGTSAAAPHVAGAVAQIKSRFPAFNNQQVKTYLYNNSTYDLGELGIDSIYGYGALVLPDPYPANSNDTTIVDNCNDTTIEEPEIAPCTTTPCSGSNCIVVTNGNDSGSGSLRQAIADIPDGGTITFDPSVSIVNIISTITINAKSMTIDGCPGVTINGAGNHRLLMFEGNNSGTVININHITLQNGYRPSENNVMSSGAAFWVREGIDLNLTDVIIQNNGGGSRSGALVIYKSTINCTRCFFLNNWSTGQAGALVHQDAVGNFTQSVFRGNIAEGDTLSDGTQLSVNGGAILTFSAHTDNTLLSLTDCIFEDNTANKGYGGGISISNNGDNKITTVNIDNTIVEGNASQGGGGIAVGNTGTLLNMTNSRIFSNVSILGGGVLVANSNATATFSQCDIRDNSATDQGGGILVVNDQATLNLNQTTVSQNNAGSFGGGIANFGGIVNVRNTLVDHNASTGIGWAGGILSVSQRRDTTDITDDDDACLNIYNSTIADNLGVHNNGLLVVKEGTADSKLTIQNTILCNPSGNSEFKDYSNCDTDVLLTACGGNIACDTTATSIFIHPTDQNNTDPLFIDAENGNYNLQSCSPAIDVGQNSCEPSPTEDLACNSRGIADSGAYEYIGGGSNGPIAYAGPYQFICPGDSVVIGSESMANCGDSLTYEWMPSTGLSDPYSATPIAKPPTTTLYTLIVTDANGSSAIDAVEVQVGPLVGIIEGTTSITANASGETYNVANTPGSSYQWTLSNDAIAAGASIVSGQGSNEIEVNWGSAGGLLSVFETTMDGCVGVPSSIMVFLENCSNIYCPNPNNGSNNGGIFYGQVTIDYISANAEDWIVAYDPDGNVAGATTLTVDNNGIAYVIMEIFADDPSTSIDEGMGANDNYFLLKLYDESEEVELVYPNATNPVQFVDWVGNSPSITISEYSDYTQIYNFESCKKDIIPLNMGWNLISFDVTLNNNSVDEVFSSLIPSNLQRITGFDNGSTIYDPTLPPLLNLLTNIEDGYGYWVRVQVADTLEVCGIPIPETYKKNLDPGWNLIGYPPLSCTTPEIYLDDLITDNNLIYATGFDQGPTIFDIDNPGGLPFFNTLDSLCNGFGYWVKTTNAMTAGNWRQYNDSNISTSSSGGVTTTPIYTFLYGYSNLDASYTGSKIQVYANSSGILCGEIEVLDGGLLMTAPVYGDDLNTTEIEGASQGEELRFAINGMPMTGSFIFNGDLSPHEIYLSLDVTSSIDEIEDKYQLSIMPNPLSSLTEINYTLEKDADINLKVINIHGQLVEVLFDENKQAGKHNLTWNASEVPSGTYWLSFEVDGLPMKTAKLIIIR